MAPAPVGGNDAASSAAAVAAPLLAGFALTLAGLVLQVQNDLKWPDAALAVLVGSVLALLGAVQFGVWARQYAVTPAQLKEWLPSLDDKALLRAQYAHQIEHARWYSRFRGAYHVGIMLLLAGLAVALVPDKDTDEWRYVAIGLAGLGVVGELTWIWAGRQITPKKPRPWARRLAERLVPSADGFGLPSTEADIRASLIVQLDGLASMLDELKELLEHAEVSPRGD
jgi:MFS family permease